MDSLEKYIVDRKNGIIKLLTPPFDQGELEPGYGQHILSGTDILVRSIESAYITRMDFARVFRVFLLMEMPLRENG